MRVCAVSTLEHSYVLFEPGAPSPAPESSPGVRALFSIPLPVTFFYLFSATRSLALRALGLAVISSCEGVTGLRVTMRSVSSASHVQPAKSIEQRQNEPCSEKNLFTILSSKEW